MLSFSLWNMHFTCDPIHYSDVIMTTMASQITSLMVVYSTVYSDADQRKHQSSALLAFVWGSHRDRWIPRTKGQLRGNVSIWWHHHGYVSMLRVYSLCLFKCLWDCSDVYKFTTNIGRNWVLPKAKRDSYMHATLVNDRSHLTWLAKYTLYVSIGASPVSFQIEYTFYIMFQ